MRRTPGLALMLALVASLVLSAQVRYRPTESGPWRPWSFTGIASARQARGATAADVQAWQATLQGLGAIVKRAPAVAQPIGFAAELWGNLDGYYAGPGEPAGKAVPLAGALSFAAFPLVEFTRNGRLMNEDLKGGETETMGFAVNAIGREMFSSQFPGEWSGEEVAGFTEPKMGEPYAGLTRIDDVFVVKKGEKPLWVPMAIADAVAPVVAQRRRVFENRRDSYAKQQAAFTTWSTPEARAARRAEWAQTAKDLGPKGPGFVADMEKSDAEIEKSRRTSLAPGGPDERGVKDAEREWQEADAILAPLSPAARTAPACYDTSARVLASKFRAAAGAPRSCLPLVTTNWDYFDRMLPRAAPQVVMITGFARCLRPESVANTTLRGGCAINRALLESMDWTAVKAWLR